MAEIAVVGAAGYVGLAYAVALAARGHHVTGVDRDAGRIAMLNAGTAPLHEPGLPALLARGLASGQLSFTTAYAAALPAAEVVFICVGTPATAAGAADTTAVAAAATAIARHSRGHTIVVTKSTMPVGSVQVVADILAEHAPAGATFAVVANPEFLREGSALHDICHPDRIVLGADDPEAARAVGALYGPRAAPLLVTTPRSAELIKYAANAFLATKISFINEIALLCERLGADVDVVARGMGLDARIAPAFLQAGLGFGGSCFPKDVRALAAMARAHGCDAPLLTATLDINARMRAHVLAKLAAHLGGLDGQRIALLGLAFKPETDDLREAPALALLEALLAAGATVRVTDPVAAGPVAARFPAVPVAADAYGAAMGADAVVLATEWPAYRALNLARLANAMRGRLVLDGRNALVAADVVHAGLIYEGIGRPGSTPTPVRTTEHAASLPPRPLPASSAPAGAARPVAS